MGNGGRIPPQGGPRLFGSLGGVRCGRLPSCSSTRWLLSWQWETNGSRKGRISARVGCKWTLAGQVPKERSGRAYLEQHHPACRRRAACQKRRAVPVQKALLVRLPTCQELEVLSDCHAWYSLGALMQPGRSQVIHQSNGTYLQPPWHALHPCRRRAGTDPCGLWPLHSVRVC